MKKTAIILLRKKGSDDFFRFWTDADSRREAYEKTKKLFKEVDGRIYVQSPSVPAGYIKFQGAYIVDSYMIPREIPFIGI